MEETIGRKSLKNYKGSVAGIFLKFGNHCSKRIAVVVEACFETLKLNIHFRYLNKR